MEDIDFLNSHKLK